MGIEEVLSAPRSPWQRAYIERVIGSIRRERRVSIDLRHSQMEFTEFYSLVVC